MSAIEIAQRNADQARADAAERWKLIQDNDPEMAAAVMDIRKSFPEARIVEVNAPWLKWKR